MPSFQEHLETIARWQRFPALERVDSAGNAAVLTFDDGPDPDATPAVLEALDHAGARATFFLVGEQALAHRALAREVADRGHEVALHGYAHVAHDDLTPTQTRDDLARGLGTLQVATGRTPRWYRPPYGRFTEASFDATGALDLRPVYWSAWGGDWEAIAPERITELVARDLEAGAIVVLHDSARYMSRQRAGPTAEALPAIAEEARRRGLRLVPLAEATGA